LTVDHHVDGGCCWKDVFFEESVKLKLKLVGRRGWGRLGEGVFWGFGVEQKGLLKRCSFFGCSFLAPLRREVFPTDFL